MNKNIPITVGFTVDENYVQHLYITMLSILHNRNTDIPLDFIILGDRLSEKSLNVLSELALENNVGINFPEVNFDVWASVKVPPHVSRATCGRLAIPNVITADKILFLDCDLIIKKDINALWNTDISEYYAGAVIDPAINYSQHYWGHKKKLGLSYDQPFFNSGVMLLNLKKCRMDNIASKCIDFLQNADFCFSEQDSLNAIMRDKLLFLPFEWNVQNFMFRICYSFKRRRQYPFEIINAVKDPAIVHYTDYIKPWHYDCDSPYIEEYYEYLSQTLWKNYKPAGWTFRGMIRKNRRVFKRRLKSAILGYRV